MRAQCYRSLRFLRNKSYGPQLGAVRMVKGERGRWNDGRRLDAGSREKNEKEGRKGERRAEESERQTEEEGRVYRHLQPTDLSFKSVINNLEQTDNDTDSYLP